MEPLAIGVEDFAERFGICRASVYNWMNAGEIRTIRIGGRRLIPMAEVERILTTFDEPPKAK